jgi:hypothetical protein
MQRLFGLLFGLCLAGLLAAVIGCGPSSKGTPAPSQPTIGSNQDLKQRLEYIAQSGVTGSALGGLQDAVKKAGKPELEKDLGELEKAQSPDAVKAIAKRMADKL